MRLRDLPAALDAAGLPVVETPGWLARGKELTAVRGVVWHHTGSPHRAGRDMPTLQYLINGGSTPPWGNIGLGRSGTCYLVAGGRANHAGVGSWHGLTGNSDTIGIEMESPGDGSWTPEQRAIMPVLGRAIRAAYGVPTARQISHAEWALPRGRKTDPVGVDMRALRRLIDMAPPEHARAEEDEMNAAQEAVLRDTYNAAVQTRSIAGDVRTTLLQVQTTNEVLVGLLARADNSLTAGDVRQAVTDGITAAGEALRAVAGRKGES